VAKKPDILDTKTAAAELGVSVRRLQQLIASGRLPAIPIGRYFAIRRADLAIVRHRKPGRPPKQK
jgi:excisionase family DNA binding protein